MTTIKCAPSKNLNSAFPHFATAKELYAHLLEITAPVSNRFSLLPCVGYFCIIREMLHLDVPSSSLRPPRPTQVTAHSQSNCTTLALTFLLALARFVSGR
jgi:hypothetical protein